MDRHCKNCDRLLYAGHDYCSKCGSKYVDFRLTPKAVFNEVSERYIGFDNKFLMTMIALVKFPEDVINGYVTGMRKKYMNPINFYILSLTMVGIQIFVIKHFGADLQNDQLFPMNESHIRATEAVMDYLGLISTINLPLYALSGYLTYKNLKQYNFTEHLIFSSYIWGFYNIVTTIFTLPIIFLPPEFSLITLIPVPLSIFHIFYGYHRIFNLSWGRSVLKAFIYLLISSIQFFILFVFLVVIIVFVLIQFFPEYLESIKAISNGSSL